MPDFTPRPTVYKGIKMRSRLEAGFAQWLDEYGIPEWEYEPKAFGSAAGQYLPDFYVPVAVMIGMEYRMAPAYIEVKPRMDWEELPALAKRMAVIWESEPDTLLILAAPVDAPGDTFGVGVVDADIGPASEGLTFMGMHVLLTGEGCPLTLGYACPRHMGPWFGKWWEVK